MSLRRVVESITEGSPVIYNPHWDGEYLHVVFRKTLYKYTKKPDVEINPDSFVENLKTWLLNGMKPNVATQYILKYFNQEDPPPKRKM
jgi:hypothetical protein